MNKTRPISIYSLVALLFVVVAPAPAFEQNSRTVGQIRSFAKDAETSRYYAVIETRQRAFIAVPISEIGHDFGTERTVTVNSSCDLCQPVPGTPVGPNPPPLPSPFLPAPSGEVIRAHPWLGLESFDNERSFGLEDLRSRDFQLDVVR